MTCEIDPHHAEVAAANFARAGVDKLIDLRVGPARDTLATLEGAFDLAFIDADKASGADYFRSCVRLVRPGGVIIVDNVVRAGTILDPGSADEAVIGTWRLADAIAAEPRRGRHGDADRRRQAARRLRDGGGAVVRPPLTAVPQARRWWGRPGRRGAQATVVSIATSMLPRVAFEYGHTWCAASATSCRRPPRRRPGMLDVQRDGEAEAAVVDRADADVGGDRAESASVTFSRRATHFERAQWKQAA